MRSAGLMFALCLLSLAAHAEVCKITTPINIDTYKAAQSDIRGTGFKNK